MDALKADSVREHRESKRANLRRQFPDETEDQIDARLSTWMADG